MHASTLFFLSRKVEMDFYTNDDIVNPKYDMIVTVLAYSLATCLDHNLQKP